MMNILKRIMALVMILFLSTAAAEEIRQEDKSMANYREDIVNIELSTGLIYRSFMKKSIGEGDNKADRFGIRAYRNGVPENLSGTCSGLFIRADGVTVPVTDGVVSGNMAYVTLPEACYVVEGCFCLAIKVITENDAVTMRIVDGMVSRTSTDVIVDPGTIIPSVQDLFEAIGEAVASIPPDYSDLWENLVFPYSTAKDYFIGQYVCYDQKIYKYRVDHSAGTFNANECFLVASLADEVANHTTDLSSRTVIVFNRTIPVGGGRARTIFTNEDVKPGEKIYINMHIPDGSTTPFFVQFIDINGNSLGYAGKTATGSQTVVSVDAVIPSGFSYANIDRRDNTEVVYIDSIIRYYPVFEKIENIHEPVSLYIDFQQGNYNGQGSFVYADDSIVSQVFCLPIGTVINVVADEGYYTAIAEWAEIGESYTQFSGRNTGSFIYVTKDKYQRINITKEGMTNIIPSEKTNVSYTSNTIHYIDEATKPLFSTGDDTDRSKEISDKLECYGSLTLGSGEFYVSDTITIPKGATLSGCGENTVIIANSGSIASVISLTTDCTVKNLKIQGTETTKPQTQGTMNGISILQKSSRNTVKNVVFVGLSKSGVYGYDTYIGIHDQNIIEGCNFSKCYCGIDISTRAEAFSVIDCAIIDCYIGVNCIAGNSRISACIIRGCEYGFTMISSSASDNDGHSTFFGCVIIHNTHSISIEQIENGAIFNGCTVYYGDIIISNNAKGIVFNGCEFGSIEEITGTGSLGARIMNSIFENMESSVVTNVELINCTKIDGSVFDN